jgi:hypothetical protein
MVDITLASSEIAAFEPQRRLRGDNAEAFGGWRCRRVTNQDPEDLHDVQLAT